MFRSLSAAAFLAAATLPVPSDAMEPVDLARLLLSVLPEGVATHTGLSRDDGPGATILDMQLRNAPLELKLGDIAFLRHGDSIRITFPEDFRALVVDGSHPEAEGRLRHRNLAIEVLPRAPDLSDARFALRARRIHGWMETHPRSPRYPGSQEDAMLSAGGLSGWVDLDGERVAANLSADSVGAIARSLRDRTTVSAAVRGLIVGGSVPRSLVALANPSAILADLFDQGSNALMVSRRLSFVALERYGGARVDIGRSRIFISLKDGVLNWDHRGAHLHVETISEDLASGRFDVSVPTFSLQARLPFFPGVEDREAFVRFAIPGIDVSGGLRDLLDPAGALPTTPLGVALDVTAQMQHPATLEGAISALRGGVGIDRFLQDHVERLDLERIEIREMSISGFGATASVTGELSLRDALEMPEGELMVTVTGLDALVAAIGEGDLVPRRDIDRAMLLLGMYFDRDRDGTRTARILLEDGAIIINDIPFL